KMKVGYFDTRVDPPPQRPYHQLLDDLREEVVLSEEVGFDSAWLGEHHLGPEGMDQLPNAILLCADLACRTSRIRLGQAANLLPYWHPIRLAEDIAMLDQMTKGRIVVAVGRGVRSREGAVFHPKSDPKNEEANRELFEETLGVIRKAWTQPFFSHRGPNYTFPAPNNVWNHPLSPADPQWADGEVVTKLHMVPKPYQKPHPPLWMVTDTDRSITFAAKHGLKVIAWQPPPQMLRRKFELYARIRSEAEGRAFALGEDVAVMRTTYVAPTMEEARRDAERGVIQTFGWTQARRPLDNFMDPGEEVTPEMKLDWDLLFHRNLLIGSPEYVVEKIQELQEIVGVKYLLTYTTLPWIPHSKVMRSIELFASKVMPLVEKAKAGSALD
ncbi:MAG: LLM class flavin-dependent oxidoreductase, partial [Dehalococcoidia bacterium]